MCYGSNFPNKLSYQPAHRQNAAAISHCVFFSYVFQPKLMQTRFLGVIFTATLRSSKGSTDSKSSIKRCDFTFITDFIDSMKAGPVAKGLILSALQRKSRKVTLSVRFFIVFKVCKIVLDKKG